VWYLVGEIENALVTAQMAVQGMIAECADYSFTPDVRTANAIPMRKTIAARAFLTTVEKALQAVGGAGLFRGFGARALLARRAWCPVPSVAGETPAPVHGACRT
jgi:hypothetical protein